jgi:hypothetical protein
MFTSLGTLVTKAMTSVTKEVSRGFLVNKVLPAIKAKWPAEEKGLPIYIQQDNAKTHIDVNDLHLFRPPKQMVGTLGSHANLPILLTLMYWILVFLQQFRHYLKREHQTTLTAL